MQEESCELSNNNLFSNENTDNFLFELDMDPVDLDQLADT